jgi:hypothetical protein
LDHRANKMSKTDKILLTIAAVVGVGALVAFFINWEIKLNEQQAILSSEIIKFKQIGDGIARDRSQFATKDDLEAMIQQLNLQKVESDLAKLQASVEGLQVVIATTPGGTSNNLPSTNTKPNPQPGPIPTGDPFGYLTNSQILALSEPLTDKTSIPFGATTFSAWRQNPWDVTVYPRTYTVDTVLGQDQSGKHYVYNKFTIQVQDKTYTLPIKQAQFTEELPSAGLHFSPRMYLSGDVGVRLKPLGAEVIPSLGVSLLSYGKTTIDPDWSFATIGLGYATQNKHLAVTIAPVNYNLGHHLPYMNNLHIGPALSLDTSGALTTSIGIRVGL